VPVLPYFVGAAAAAPTKHARTGTFVHILGDFRYKALRRKASTVCYDDYWNHWAKDMHIKDMKNMRPHGITELESVKYNVTC
jgi:hypothetical protein